MRTIYVDKDIPRILLVSALRPVWPGAVLSSLAPARYAEVADPPLPGPRWVRVKTTQCGICASDLALLTVDAAPSIGPSALPGTERFYLGHELVGEVREVGAGVTRVRLGDRVVMDAESGNCHSQEIDPPCPQCTRGNQMLCENASAGRGPHGVGGGWSDNYTAHETSVAPVPPSLTDDQATLVEPLSVGVRAALRRLPEAGQRALVLGSGTIGLCTLQAVRALSPDCHLTAVARYGHQAALAGRFGADEVIDGKDLYGSTARITGARLYRGMMGSRMLLGGFDTVFDCVGSAHTLSSSLCCARAGGAVVLVGVKLRPLKVDLTPVWYQEVDLVGTFGHGTDTWQGRAVPDYDLVLDLLRQGKLTADGFITHRYPLSRWREAVRTAMDKRSGAIKVVIDHRL